MKRLASEEARHPDESVSDNILLSLIKSHKDMMNQLNDLAEEDGEDSDDTAWILSKLPGLANPDDGTGLLALDEWLTKHNMTDLWGKHPANPANFVLQTPFAYGGHDGLGANRIKLGDPESERNHVGHAIIHDIAEGYGETTSQIKLLEQINSTINRWNDKLVKYDGIAQTKGLNDQQQQEKAWVSKKLHVNMAWANMLTKNIATYNAN